MLRYKKFKSIKTELLIVGILGFFIVISLITIYLTLSLRQKAQQNAENAVFEAANNFSNKIKLQFEQALNTAQTLSYSFSSIAAQNIVLNVDRNQVNAFLKSVLLQNKEFTSIFSIWEPNSFDKADKSYLNNAGQDETGRFIPMWSRDSIGNTVLNAMKYFDGSGIGDYYQIPKRTLGDALIDPYYYPIRGKDVFTISLVSPITYNNIFFGVIGVNIDNEIIQRITDENKQFNNKAQIEVISNNGTYVAHSEVDSLIGKKIQDFYPNFREQLSEIQNGNVNVRTINDYIEASVPIQVGNTNHFWQVRFKVPAEILLADSSSQTWKFFLIGLILMLLITIFITYYLNELKIPLHELVAISNKISVGDLEINFDLESQDEIGEINKSLFKLNHALIEITNITRSIATGDLEKNIEIKSEKDILGKSINIMVESLKKSKEETEASRKEVAIRNWNRQGLAELSQILSQNYPSIEELTVEIIKNIINYLTAAQGGIFVLNDAESNDIYLELVASIAYDQRKFIEKKIYPGEGLVGTSFVEKQTIYLKKIPDGYIKVGSGLGGSKPKCLLIVPLKIENQVLGIFELTSFQEFSPYEIEFIEKVSENIAISLSTAKISKQTRLLLMQSQIQAEELANREEALRLNFDELQSAQEESQAREAEMLSVLNILEESFLVAEMNLEGEILKINSTYAGKFGFSSEYLVGKNYREIRLMNHSFEEYQEIIQNIKNGSKQIVVETVTTLQGVEIWFSSIFSPILDRTGTTYKILDITSDITESKQQEGFLKNQSLEFKKQSDEFIMASIENRSLLKAIDDSLMEGEYSPEGIILRLNENYIRTTGYKSEELIGKSLFNFLSDVEKEQFEKLWKFILQGKSYKVVVERENKYHQKVWVKASYVPVRNFDGNIYKVFVIGNDITEFYQKELEALNKIDDLQRRVAQLSKT